ncbi:43903_t:CDS:2, partial [Gigaspora margarita]
ENITCPVRNCQDRIKNIEAVEEDISDLAEALKPRNTPKGFLLLYKNIDQAEKLLARLEKNIIYVKKEVILSYYQLGKADTKKLKELLKIPTPLCTVQNKIVADIKKLLPSNTSINVIKKRIATPQKIYNIFSTIGEDKIQRIRNFSASSIGAFKKDEIEFIKTGDNKSKFRIERESSNIWTDFDIWEHLIYFRKNNLLPNESKKYLEARRLIQLPNSGSYTPEIGIAICFSFKKKSISGYDYDNEYALHQYGLWMQNAIKKIECAREIGKKIQAVNIIQQKWLEYFYRPDGLCATELAQHYQLL